MAATIRDCALTGALGILTGFAVFALTWDEQSGVFIFLAILILVTIFAAAFEYIRDVIETSGASERSEEDRRSALSRIVIKLFLIASFELFITAIHASLSLIAGGEMSEVGTAVLGPDLAQEAGPKANIVLMALAWILIGAVTGAAMAFAITSVKDARLPRALQGGRAAALIGLAAGGAVAPLVVFGYVVLARFAVELKWMFSQPDDWIANVQHLHDRMAWNAFEFPVKAGTDMVLVVYSWFHGPAGIIAAAVVLFAAVVIAFGVVLDQKERQPIHYFWAAAAPLAIFGAPLLGPSLGDDVAQLGKLLLLVIVVWAVPGLLLGLAVPYVRRPSHHRRIWTAVAWLAAALMVLFAYVAQTAWVALFAALLVAVALLFSRGVTVEHYWPLMALCVSAIVLGATSLSASFVNIQDLSRQLLALPLAKVSPPAPPLGSLLLPRYDARGFVNPFALDVTPLFGTLGDALVQLRKHQQLVAQWNRRLDARTQSIPRLERDAATKVAELDREDAANRALTMAAASKVRDLPQLMEADARSQRVISVARQPVETELQALERLEGSYPPVGFAVRDPQKRADVGRLARLRSRVTASWSVVDAAVARLRASDDRVRARIPHLRDELTQRFELCLTGSFGFWMTLGILAGWARQEPMAAGLT